MKIYLMSLGAGVLVGVVYSLVNVRSPAPPVVALVGLLGILLGEQRATSSDVIVWGMADEEPTWQAVAMTRAASSDRIRRSDRH